MKTKLVELQNGENKEVFEVAEKSGAKTGDLIFDETETKFHPVYRLGNTNICFEKYFQSKIHKVIKSSRDKDNLPFE
jgi:hypothetical protein